MKKLAKLAAVFGCLAILFTGVSCDNGSDDSGNNNPNPGDSGSDTSTALASDAKIYLVGDSTVCEYFDANGNPTDNYYLPRYGWGTQLHEYLNVEKSQVVNLALSGRSSKSFLTEANYTTLTRSIKSGDYLIIGFGHNDEKTGEAARFTDPNGTKDTETTGKGTSLKWNFYEKYVKMAKDKGATPILCTPICRYDSKNAYTGSVVHVTGDGDYPKAIIELGTETNTTVIDLTKLTSDVYKADNDAAIFFHAHTTYKGDPKTPPYDGTEEPDGLDGTHINMFGAKMVSYQFAQALKTTDCALKNSVKSNKTAPTKASDYLAAIKNDYIKPNYKAPNVSKLTKLATTTKNETSVDWYKSAFGVLGGEKANNYKITYADSKFKIVADTGSKFSSSGDGMGAAFVQLPKNKQFKATAKMKVTEAAANLEGQVACGMMLRDDMLIDTQDTTLASNFVAAGINGNGKAIFSRDNAAALTVEKNSMTLKTDGTVEYTVSIEFLGQTTNVSVSNGTNTFTKSPYQDFDYVARDNDYIYLCLFANRGLTVEFSDVEVEITGEFSGA